MRRQTASHLFNGLTVFFWKMVNRAQLGRFPMDVGGEYSGTVTGVMNMAGALAASVSSRDFSVFFAQAGFSGLLPSW